MDILDDSGAVSSPVAIDDLVTTSPLPSSPPPLAATRNQATITSLIANPFQSQDSYNTIMGEAQQGQDTTQKLLKQQAQAGIKEQDQKSLMGILADPKTPIEQKQQAVSNFHLNPVMTDTSTILQTNLLSKPSAGETVDSENARISTADTLNEMATARAGIQVLSNHLKPKDTESAVSTFFDHASNLIPFKNAITENKVYNDLAAQTGVPRKWWENFTTYVRPGTAARDLQGYVQTLPPQQQLAVAKAMFNSVQNHSGFLYGNDNQHEAFEQFNKIFNTESYGMGSEFLDNLGGIADLAFAGSQIKDIGLMGKNVARMVKGGEGALTHEESLQFAKANANTPSNVRQEGTVGTGPVVNDVAEPSIVQEGIKTPVNQPKNVGSLLGGDGQAVQAAQKDVGALLTPRSMGVAQEATGAAPSGTAALLGGTGVKEAATAAKIPALLLPKAVQAAPKENLAQLMARMAKQSVTHDINPNSPMEIAQNANPDSARGFHEAVIKGTDEMSDALTGVDKEQAIVNNVMPQTSDTGVVFSRVNDIDRNARIENSVDPKLVDLVNDTSVNALTPAEQAQARARMVNDFGNATGLVANDAMTSFKWEGNRAIINQVYEVPGGSFSKAEDALEQAKYALRHYGVTDDDITILEKQGVNHVPVDAESVRSLEGDYKIQVKSNPEVNPSWFDEMSALTVKRNPLDRFAGTNFGDRASLQRYALDAASMLDKHITGPAAIAKDYGARFEKAFVGKAEDFAKDFRSFPEARQAKINDYIREANFKGIDFDQADLAARGFNNAEVGAIRKWRDFWDDHHYLENLDVVRSLRNQGYEYFKNSNAELFARPIGPARNVTRFYDPATDAVRSFAPGELDDLYNNGGTIAKLRRPATLSGETVEHMIIRQSPTEYSRALKDSDRVLNKRKGYYSISYNGAKFIDEVDGAGNKIRTVAVAGDTNEAKAFIKRMVANDPSKAYSLRNDSRNFRFNSDEHWDINSAGGRINQRQRGQLLEDASAPSHIGDTKYIDSPAKSAERAAKSISGRTVMRNMLDTASERFMKQYEEVLPKNAWGEARFPQSANDIGRLGETTSKRVADARTTWEYLNYLRNGYINSLSDGMKAVFNVMADEVGEKGFATTERALRAVGEKEPLSMMKKTVFAAYLATNPLRQIITQSAQAWRITSYNPIGIISGRIPKLINEFYGNHAFGSVASDFVKFMDRSGFTEAVKHHNLIASSLTSLADQQNILSKGVSAVTQTLRRVGFDSGELANMVAHSAAVYDRYKALGRDVKDRTVMEQMQAEIRHLTYNMNAAGDMPYNQGAAAAMLQFMQMPHKAMLFYTNRGIDPAVRARMAVGDLILWGTALDGLSNALNFDFLPDDGSTTSEVLRDGVVSTLYNHALNAMFEGTHKADFSALSPYGLDGWLKLWHSLTGQGVYQTVMNSPSAGLIGSRFSNVAKNMASFFNPKPFDDRQTPEKFVDLLTSTADLSSGFSNAHKAYLVQKFGERRDQYGQLIDSNTTTGDTIAQAFGFTSQAQTQNYDLANQMRQDTNSHKKEVLQVYKDIKKFYAQHYYQNENPDIKFMTDITGAAMQYYANDPVAMKIIQQQWERDSVGTDANLTKQMFNSFNLPGMTDYRTRIANLSVDDNTKKQMNAALDYAKNAQAELDKYTKENK
jgi:predicted ArsR family transcriptional regulator